MMNGMNERREKLFLHVQPHADVKVVTIVYDDHPIVLLYPLSLSLSIIIIINIIIIIIHKPT